MVEPMRANASPWVLLLVLACASGVGGCHGSSVGEAPDATSNGDSAIGADSDSTSSDDTADAPPTLDALDTPDALDGAADVDGDAEAVRCDGGKGAVMVKVTTPSGSYCIDTTETTNAEYNAFLADPPPFNPQPAGCEGHSSWGTPVVGADDVVHGNVTWCDAYAYCKWAGKRLCGHIGDGAVVDWKDVTDPTKGEWVYACISGNSANSYPYGASYDPRVCNSGVGVGGADVGPPKLAAPKSYPDCHGFGAPFASIFDMAGNVNEWEDTCHLVDGFGLECAIRGGAAGEEFGGARESCAEDPLDSPVQWGTAGIRCCK